MSADEIRDAVEASAASTGRGRNAPYKGEDVIDHFVEHEFLGVRCGRLFVRLSISAVLVASSLWSDGALPDIKLFPAPLSKGYSDAAEPGAIQYACANNRAALEMFFSNRDLPIDAKLIRGMQGQKACHIFYEPSVRGFRALPDNNEIQELFATPDLVALVTGPKSIGESHDILRSVLPRLDRPLRITLGVDDDYDSAFLTQVTESYFSQSVHQINYVPIPPDQGNPWAQDFFKAGSVEGTQKTLVPRRLFEGRNENGSTFSDLLDTFSDEPYFRSKLSWEGGDLQFVLSPRDPNALLLFFGESTVDYWGEELLSREIAYILRLEFGADRVIDLSAAGPHTHYLVAFLPETATALVAQPLSGSRQLAIEAARQIGILYGSQTPKELEHLMSFLDTAFNGLSEDPAYITRELQILRSRFEEIEATRNEGLQKDLDDYTQQHCPQGITECLGSEGQKRMLTAAPDLLRRLLEEDNHAHIRKEMPKKLVDLIAAQFPGELNSISQLLDEKATEIPELGFRVIRVPYLYPGQDLDRWKGISHVNLLAHERKLFVPTFGLGNFEAQLLAKLQKKLSPEYEVIPIYARSTLLLNGGIHCVFGITRGLKPAPPPRVTQLRRKPPGIPVMPEKSTR